MLNKKTIRDISVSGKKVLVRCDFNVPLDKNNPAIITSDKRIKESLKTINYLIGAGAKTILCSHLGKTGQNKSLKPVAKKLSNSILCTACSTPGSCASNVINDLTCLFISNSYKF